MQLAEILIETALNQKKGSIFGILLYLTLIVVRIRKDHKKNNLHTIEKEK